MLIRSFTTDPEELKERFDAADLQGCHDFLQTEDLIREYDREKFEDAHDEYFNLEILEENEFLFAAEELFERAEREYTTHLIEVERRIALSIIHRFEGTPSRVPEAVVDEAIETVKLSLRRGLTQLADCKRRRIPFFVMEGMEFSVRKNRYTLLALKKNRPWLIEFLSQ